MNKAVSMILVTAILLSPMMSSNAQTQPQMLELMQQLTQLEKEMRQLRGAVERLSYENNRLKSQQNDLYLDMEQRISTLERLGSAGNRNLAEPTPGSAAGTLYPVTGTAAPQSVQPGISALATLSPPVTPGNAVSAISPALAREQADYKVAFNLLRSGQYDEAITAYNGFLLRYPNGRYAANAQYWLGEANYVTRRFSQALDEFQKVITNYPDSKKIPDVMLKIGYIQYEL